MKSKLNRHFLKTASKLGLHYLYMTNVVAYGG